MAKHALSDNIRTDDSDNALEADESEPDNLVVESKGSDEVVLIPDDESKPASEGNSNSGMEDPQPVVIDDLVCDAPVAPQPPEPPIRQAGVSDGEIG